ncbi:MAG: hypothetical protein ACJA06_001281 [Halocynthiibacter sp.]|jgi:hypothetical protein
MPFNPKTRARHIGQSIRPDGLASFGPAQANGMFARRSLAKIMIERDNAMCLGARDPKRGGNHWQSLLRDMTQSSLNSMKDRQQRPLKAPMLSNDLIDLTCP